MDGWMDRGIDRGEWKGGLSTTRSAVDRLSRASINRIAAQRTMVAMHACVDPPPFVSSKEN